MRLRSIIPIPLLLILPACATPSLELNANHKAVLESHERIAQYLTGMDRSAFVFEVGDKPVELPAGTKMTFYDRPPEIPMPAQWRDYAYEAQVREQGSMFREGLRALLAGWAIHRIVDGVETIAKTSGGTTITADGESTAILSGGVGDRTSGIVSGGVGDRTSGIVSGTYSESFTPGVEVVRPEVVITPAPAP